MTPDLASSYGGVLSVLGCAILLLPIESGTGLWLLRLNSLVLGFGLGAANTAAVIAVQEAVEWKERGVATAAMLFMRSIGGALAAGSLGALLAASLLGQVPSGASAELLGAVARGLEPPPDSGVQKPLEGGMHRLFQVVFGASLVACLATLLSPKHLPKKTEDRVDLGRNLH
jgi:MFS family permease